jgi:hypothetical protein
MTTKHASLETWRVSMRATKACALAMAGAMRSRVTTVCVAICVFTAVVVAFSLYPGWFFFDSATQWGWARQIAIKGLPDELMAYGITSHWPIFNTLLKVPFYWLTGEAGFYIFVQAAIFDLSLYLLGATLLGRRSWWLVVYTLLMVWSPISINYSVFQSSDTIVAICTLTAVAMSVDRELGFARRACLVIVAILVMSWVRYNALPASVFLACFFFWNVRGQIGLRHTLMCLAVVLVVLGGSVAALRAYEHQAHMRDSAAGGVAMRLLDASHHTDDARVHALIDPYVAANPALRAPLTPDCYEHAGWCAQMNGTPWRDLSTAKFMHAYLHLLIHHPVVFTQTNFRFAMYSLGLKAPLETTQMGRIDITPPFPAARMTYNHRRLAYFDALQAALGAIHGLAARAGVICVLGLLVAWLLRRRGLVASFALLAVGYLGPLLLLVGTNNFRYTFPVTIVGMGIIAAGCCVFARFVVMRGGARSAVVASTRHASAESGVVKR